MNPYEMLGVSRTATQDEIKSAYRKIAAQLHPDRNPDPEASSRLKDINAAYELIKTPEKRAAYDQPASSGGFKADPNYSQSFNSDFVFNHFHDIFKRQQTTKSFNIPIELTIEEVFEGKRITKTVSIDGEEIELDFAVPAGVPDGATFNVKKIQSKTGFDVLINVTIITVQEKNRQRHGSDLITLVSISAFDAILGTEVEIEVIKDHKLKLKIPAGTQPDTRLIMRGQGLPIFNQANRGNTVAIIKVSIPKDLTPDQIDIIKQLR